MSTVWPSWSDFWAMGGYALYVWGSFGVTALVIIIELWLLRRSQQPLKNPQNPDSSNSIHP
ncbi:MAG: heme exporter protein CcmD [Burkholderiales bacterium]